MRHDPVALGLPHRAPFILVDAIVELDPGKLAVGERTFPASDAVFAGHFPGRPLVPGVLLTEALAQVAGCAAGETGLRLAAIKAMKFPHPAFPDQCIRLTATLAGSMPGLWQFACQARVGETVVAEGQIVLGREAA